MKKLLFLIGFVLISIAAFNQFDYSTMTGYVNTNINTNGTQAITGAILNNSLNQILISMGLREYDSGRTYISGDNGVIYNSKLWVCNTTISVPEAWNASKWTPLTLWSDNTSYYTTDNNVNIPAGYSLYYGGVEYLHNGADQFSVLLGVGSGPSLSTIGLGNVGIGYQTLYSTTSGYYNTCLGYRSGYSLVGGYQNTFIGYLAGGNSTGYGNVFLGYSAGANETGNNKLYIHNNNSSTPLIYGDFNAGDFQINGYSYLTKDVTIGAGVAGIDYKLTFDGEDNDGVITWLEDEDIFDMSCGFRVDTAEIVKIISDTAQINELFVIDTAHISRAHIDTAIIGFYDGNFNVDTLTADSASFGDETNFVSISDSSGISLGGTREVLKCWEVAAYNFPGVAGTFNGITSDAAATDLLTNTNENVVIVKEFRGGPNQEDAASLSWRIPSDYSEGSDITVLFDWSSDGTTGGVFFGIGYLISSPADNLDLNYTWLTGTTTAPSTAFDLETVEFTIPGSSAECGDNVSLTFYRDPDNVADTMTEIAGVIRVVFIYKSNKLGGSQ